MIQAPWHILIVDDNADDRADIRQMLLRGSERRFQFDEAELGSTGLAAMRNLHGSSYDCIFLDFHLPDMDAHAVLAAMHEMGAACVVPVVVITGTDYRDGATLLRAGAMDFIGKGSNTPNSLTRTLENAVQRFALQADHAKTRIALRASEAMLHLGVHVAGLGLGRMNYVDNTVTLDDVAAKLLALPGNTPVARSAVHARFHPDDCADIFECMQDALNPAGSGFMAIDHRVVRPDGSVLWLSARKQIEFSSPIGAPQHPTTGVLALLDITERKEAEARLRRSDERYRTLFNSIEEGYCIVQILYDTQGCPVDYRFVETSQSFQQQSGLSEPNGKTIRELVPAIEPFWIDMFAEVAATGDSVRREEYSHALGRWYGVYGFRFGAPEARQVAFLFNDISARKLAEFRLLEAVATADKSNKAKSEFLANMSHELRTPLNAILGFAQLLEIGAPPPSPRQKQCLSQIVKAGWYLLELINDTLDLAAIESGALPMSPEVVALTEVMAECAALIGPLALSKNTHLDFPAFETPIYAYVDRVRVKQVLINLLSNAVKYNRDGGSIHVSCSTQHAGNLRINVRDTGEGIASDKLVELFTPFNRLGRETSAVQGTGIGLAMCKRLTELMDGKIGVSSTLGVGSDFWIDVIAASAPIEPQMHASPAIGPRTVLHVDDNPTSLELVEHLLAQRSDYQVFSATHGGLGIELARAHQPAVILMDINLPGMNGIETLRGLRADPLTSHIPVLALSANAMPNDIRKGMEAGFFRYITKPIQVEEFYRMLDEAFAFAHTLEARAAATSTRS